MNRIFLIGKQGQLGWELQRTLASLGSVISVDYPEIDLESLGSVSQLIRRIRPDLIVNAAAYTAVEQAESEQERAWKVNALAPAALAEEARRINAFLIHYSTDYVFDGSKGSPYVEQDTPHPLNSYGRSKLEGERMVSEMGGACLILRTSWVYSLRQQSGFVRKVLLWSRQQNALRIVSDQIGNPTWCRASAEITAQVVARGDSYLRDHTGLYHVAGGGFASRFEWAKMVLKCDPRPDEQTVKEIEPAITADFPARVVQPLFSALDCTRFESLFRLALPPWQEALALAMEI